MVYCQSTIRRGLHKTFILLNPRSQAAVLTGSVPIALKSACIGGSMTLPLESLKSLYASFKLLPYVIKIWWKQCLVQIHHTRVIVTLATVQARWFLTSCITWRLYGMPLLYHISSDFHSFDLQGESCAKIMKTVRAV